LLELPEVDMLKVLSLMVVGILLAAYGLYLVSTGLPIIQLPNVNWGMVGFVLIIGSAASFGTAFVASKFR